MADELDLKHLRGRLLAMRGALLELEATRKTGADTVELDQSRVGRLSRMDALLSQAMNRATSQRADWGLRRITAALARIESGDYGYCLSCDEPIAPGRLEVDPAATQCIRCAEKGE